MPTTLRRRLVGVLERRVDPRLVAGLGSVYLTARVRSRCRVRYCDGQWVHRYPDGVVVDTAFSGRHAALQDRAAEDVFLYDYRPRPGDTVVDVGAGVGGEVRLFSRLVGDAGRVVSVEAHPTTYACLRRTVELNRLGNVSPVQAAVVGAPGPVFIADDPVAHIRNGLTSAGDGSVEVPGRTLAELVDSLGITRIDLLKMNIEGAELPALAASVETLRIVEHLAVSCHDFLVEQPGPDWRRTFTPVVGLLRDAGFEVRTRPADSRPWVRHYVYASRPGR